MKVVPIQQNNFSCKKILVLCLISSIGTQERAFFPKTCLCPVMQNDLVVYWASSDAFGSAIDNQALRGFGINRNRIKGHSAFTHGLLQRISIYGELHQYG